MALAHYAPHHNPIIFLEEHPLRGFRIRVIVDSATAFIKGIGGLTKIRRIREAEDVAEQVSGIRSCLEDMYAMSADGLLDGLQIENMVFESILADIANTHEVLEDCDRLLARMKKNGIKWDLKHEVLVTSVLEVWRNFAFEMGDRLHTALVSKLKRRRDRLQGAIITFRSLRRRQQEAIEQKVQDMQYQYMEDMHQMQARLYELEQETKKAAQQAQNAQKLLMAPNGPPVIVDAQPSPNMEPTHAVAIYEPIPVLEPQGYSSHPHEAYPPPPPPPRPPTAPAPPMAPIPPPQQHPRYYYDHY